ncbi:nitrate- and nitrite sensing domain-containing protein [Streptomyces sp. DSM 44915]|uniref:histidine kinase n=1 Tax=Streptomyces chisholmiae TaxID=3075540 RepID=A0ABU2JL56_9ACTN|nr:nitrate- and nitrite sensing domain-containing protein [Streptomyces sp. DSM 44915]MDT0265726.1 nitrate- and nitrite sensing domain-containing protein [Streptomyces sp. DSM 44915]
MRVRGKSIQSRIWTLVLVPLLALVVLWATAAVLTVPAAFAARDTASAAERLTEPVQGTVAALQDERRDAMVYLADPRRAEGLAALTEAREDTDAALRRLRRAAAGTEGDLSNAAGSRLDGLRRTLDELERLRGQTDSNTIPLSGALDAYSDLAAAGLRLLAALPPTEDAGDERHSAAVAGLAQAREYLSQEDALVAGVLGTGRSTEDDRRALSDLITRRQTTYAHALPDLPLDDRQGHQNFWDSGTARILAEAESQVLAGGGTPLPEHWAQSTADVLDGTGALARDAAGRLSDRLDSSTTPVVLRAALVGGLGLAAVVVAALVALRGGRSLGRDLTDLAREARDTAEVRLPGVTRRLAAGEHVDVETEAPRLEYGEDEIGQIGRALNTLQREAVSASVERSYTRRGVSEVFVNLARRSQVLLHRQLHLLETLERRSQDREARVDLVRLDHLSTKMRRHAEGLVILSGAAPARHWRKPEHLSELVRAAVEEIEDFERVEIRRLPPLVVAGGAVADLVQLIAELLENATVFSPPHTTVQVSGERVPHGVTLEIHDRGLGMTADALREANQRLTEITEFQLSDTDRIGLFVVARLAERHHIRVALRESPYGGTTAVTLIPGELLSEPAEPPPARERLPRAPGRPALLDGPVDGPVELQAAVGDDPEDELAGPPTSTGEHAADYPRPDDRSGPPRAPTAPVLVADHGRTVGRAPGEPRGGAPTPARAAGQGDARTGAGLPRRVRRPAAERAPEPAPPPGGEPGGHPDPEAAPELDADELRTRLAALQRGWRRGRQHTEQTERDEPPPTTSP